MSNRDLATEIDALAKRIAAIERAATCGTGPNELPITSPAQADVGEASASSQPPFAVGQVVECVDAGDATLLTLGRQYTVSMVEDDGSFVGFDELRDAGPEWWSSRFRPIPATVEQGPTEWMKAAAKEICKLHTAQCGGIEFSYGRAASIVSQHVGPELAAKDAEIVRLKADNVRLKDDCTVAGNNIGYRSHELKEARAEIERLKGVISSNQPNGKWLDQYGGCRVCGGEIPHGHSAECDHWKLEQQIADSKKFADDVAAAVNGWEFGTRNAYMRDLLIGQIADLRSQLSAATAANVEALAKAEGFRKAACIESEKRVAEWHEKERGNDPTGA